MCCRGWLLCATRISNPASEVVHRMHSKGYLSWRSTSNFSSADASLIIRLRCLHRASRVLLKKGIPFRREVASSATEHIGVGKSSSCCVFCEDDEPLSLLLSHHLHWLRRKVLLLPVGQPANRRPPLTHPHRAKPSPVDSFCLVT